VGTSSEPSRTDVSPCTHDGSSHPRRAVFSSLMKLGSELLVRSTTHVTALLDCAVSRVHAGLSSFSTTRRTSQCSFACDWDRVARKGWTDTIRSSLGWYPWQCRLCLRRTYFRCRTW
jgi:hypothetical protein